MFLSLERVPCIKHWSYPKAGEVVEYPPSGDAIDLLLLGITRSWPCNQDSENKQTNKKIQKPTTTKNKQANKKLQKSNQQTKQQQNTKKTQKTPQNPKNSGLDLRCGKFLLWTYPESQ